MQVMQNIKESDPQEQLLYRILGFEHIHCRSQIVIRHEEADVVIPVCFSFKAAVAHLC